MTAYWLWIAFMSCTYSGSAPKMCTNPSAGPSATGALHAAAARCSSFFQQCALGDA